ncbi:MAG TPA: immunoglobulin domain-containing protein, partial [Verrucomicrobiae bacterium]|nr:immunoglobulin domain-containing protein [Verrucomicrobiae bacterium]
PLGTPPPTGIYDPNWQFVAAYTMNSTAAAGAGRMQNPGTATVVGYESGTSVNFIVRAWHSTTGGDNWQDALPGLTIFGHSALGTATLGGQSPGGPNYSTPAAFGSGAGQIGGFRIGYPEDVPPEFLINPSNTVVSVGSDVTLTTLAQQYYMSPPIAYQWRKQLVPITGATSTNLILTNVTLADAGSYDVLASNLFGSTTSSVAMLTVFNPAIAATLSSPAYTTDNHFQFTVTGTAGSNYAVEVATNFPVSSAWISLFTNASPFTFVDSNAQNFPQRFYRAQAR